MISNSTSLLLLALFAAVVYILDRKHFRREGIMFLRRTDKFNAYVDKKAHKHRRFFQFFGDAGVVTSFGALGLWHIFHEKKLDGKYNLWLPIFSIVFFFLMAQIMPLGGAIAFALLGAAGNIMYFLLRTAWGIVAGTVTSAGIQLVLPINVPHAPVFFVPIHYWLISLFVIVVFHEFAHAFVSRAENVNVKSMGYGFLAIIPLAFAEPDEAQLKKKSSLTKNRVFSAGSFSNICVGLIVLLIIKTLFIPLGVAYAVLVENGPAANVLPEKGIVTEINGKQLVAGDVETLFMELQKIAPGDEVTLAVSGKIYRIKTVPKPENESVAFVGIKQLGTPGPGSEEFATRDYVKNIVGTNASNILNSVALFLFWIYFLSMGIALANLMPLKPLDGGLMFEEIIKKLNLDTAWVSRAGWFTGIVLLFNLMGPGLVNLVRSFVA